MPNLIYDVSRETIKKIDEYIRLLHKWNSKINLYSRQLTSEQIWKSQVADSIFLSQLIKEKKIIDVGSGNGFPGIILAITNLNDITLVERNLKKVAFLNKAKIELGLKFKVIASDIKKVQEDNYDTITSKAMASCKMIANLCQNLIKSNTRIYLLKNNSQLHELDELKKDWEFKIDLHKNKYNSSMVFEIYELCKK